MLPLCRGVARATSALLGTCGSLAATVLPAQPALSAVRAPIRGPHAEIEVRIHSQVGVSAPEAGRLAPSLSRYEIRLDSLVNGGWHIREVPSGSLGVFGPLQVRLEQRNGTLATPRITPTPMARARWATMGAEIPPIDTATAWWIARHELVRRYLTAPPMFDAPPDAGVARRSQSGYTSDHAGLRLTIQLERVSRLLRDTVHEGSPARLVRDSASFTLSHATLVPATYVPLAADRREQVRGTIIGVRIVPRGSVHAVHAADTLVLHGSLVLHDGAGDTLRTPLFERHVREAVWLDSLAVLRKRAQPFDVATLTPTTMKAAAATVSGPPPLDTRDTAAVIRRHLSYAYGDPMITHAEWAVLRSLLSDSQRAFRWRADRGILAVHIMDQLKHSPPVLAPTLQRTACEPAACRAMMRDVRARSAALRAVALVAAMVSEPRVWTDSVLHHAAHNPYVATARLFAIGSSTDAIAGAHLPIPAPHAEEAEWRAWLLGENPEYARSLASDTMMTRIRALSGMAARPRTVQVGAFAEMSLRFASVRTGSDYFAALRRRYHEAATDSTRRFFAAFLVGHGPPLLSDAEVVRVMLDPTSEARDVARAQITSLQAVRAPDSITTPLATRAIRALLGDSSAGWSDRLSDVRRFLDLPSPADSLPTHVSMDSLPDPVRELVASRGLRVMPTGWRLQPGESGHVISIYPLQQRGPFVEMQITVSTMYRRAADRSGGYARGTRLWFVWHNGEWILVDSSSWVT